jgi:hypothetical protein
VLDGGRGERGEVERGDRGRDLVGLHGRDLQLEGGEGERVAADAAAEVGDAVQARRPEPARVACRDRQPGCLLQPRLGEQHPGGELAELADRLLAQFRLGQDGGDQAGGVALLAEVGDHPQDVLLRPVRRQRVEQPEAFGAEQLDEF